MVKNAIVVLFLLCATTARSADYYEKKRDVEETTKARIALVKAGADKNILNHSLYGWSLLRCAAQNNEDLAQQLLDLGADPNYKDAYYYPLECVGSMRSIAALLKYGARLDLCTKSTLQQVFKYYSSLKKEYKPDDVPDKEWLDEEINCWQFLLEKGIDVNQKWETAHPLYGIETDMLTTSEPEKEALISFLIRHGVDANLKVGGWSDHSLFCYYKKSKNSAKQKWYTFFKQEYAKCNKMNKENVRLMLLAQRFDYNSPLAQLPNDVIKVIGSLVLVECGEKECDECVVEQTRKK